MARARESSWFSFLCEGTMESNSAPVPTSMLEIYPEKVLSEAVVPLRGIKPIGLSPTLRVQELYYDQLLVPAPRFPQRALGGPGHHLPQVVPRPGTSSSEPTSWRRAPVQLQLRGRRSHRQVSREQARAWIQKSMAHFRHTQIRKWHFGTNFMLLRLRGLECVSGGRRTPGRARGSGQRAIPGQARLFESAGCLVGPRRDTTTIRLVPAGEVDFPSASSSASTPSSTSTAKRNRKPRPRALERVPGPPSAPAMVRVGPRLRLCLRRSTGRGCTRSVSGPAITGWDARDHRDHRRRRRAHRAYEDITAEDAGPALNSDPWHESDEEPATARPPPPPTTTVPVKARAEAAPGNYRVKPRSTSPTSTRDRRCSSIKGWARLLRGHLRQQPRRPTNLTPVYLEACRNSCHSSLTSRTSG